jgi:hypothetical protein
MYNPDARDYWCQEEYLQQMEHSDPKLYVPPVDDASTTPATNSLTTVDN